MADPDKLPKTWLLRAGRPVARLIAGRRCEIRLHGSEHVPRTGPVILAGNHIGLADGPLLAAYAPRPVHALTKHELFSGAGGTFLRTAGQIPLDRFHPDPTAIRTCLAALDEGRVIGIFPEGRRGPGDLCRFHRGAAYLALVTGAPVVPSSAPVSPEEAPTTCRAGVLAWTWCSAPRTVWGRSRGRARGNKSGRPRCCCAGTCSQRSRTHCG
jgi:1-acyl-sn-glycerol-3-phosphate acyltransferase